MTFFITHENNNLNEYTATDLNGAGAVSTSAVSAMNDTSFGLQSTIAGNLDVAVAYLDYTSFGGTQYTVTFWFDPNSITMPTINPTDWDNTDATIFRLQEIGSTGRVIMEMQFNGTSYLVRLIIINDALTLIATTGTVILDEPQLFQITVTKAATAGSNDGHMEFFINGLLKDSITNLDLFTRYGDPDRVRVGLDDIDGAGIVGTCYFDQIFGGSAVATDSEFTVPFEFIENQGGGAAGGAGGGDNPASISVDAVNIYIAAFNSLGFPILIKILADLSADGSVVFDPGAGGRIGVQCGRSNANLLWVAGIFDGTNTVEKSEDAGSSFIVKDDGTFGAIRAFEMGPGSDNRVLVMDGDNGDILETIDDGATWTTINTSVTPLVNAIARLSQNVEESVFVNQGAAANSIDYSVNSGANLEDFQTGVYPNENGTGVMVN